MTPTIPTTAIPTIAATDYVRAVPESVRAQLERALSMIEDAGAWAAHAPHPV